jgi:Fe2+ or Zn2+ uptake regulation protein
VPGSIPDEAAGTAIPRADRPHSQAVCRRCGRIVEIALTLDELRAMTLLAERAPSGWRVDGLSFTLMGTCARCRSVPAE